MNQVYAVTETRNGITRVIAKTAIPIDAEILVKALREIYVSLPDRFSIVPTNTDDEDF